MGNKDEMPFPPKKLQIRSFFNLKKALETKERKAILSKNDVLCYVSRNRENNNCFLSLRAFATTSEMKQNNIQK